MRKLIQLTDVTGKDAAPIYVNADNINIIEPSGCIYFGCAVRMCGGEAVKVRESVETVVALVEGLQDDDLHFTDDDRMTLTMFAHEEETQ